MGWYLFGKLTRCPHGSRQRRQHVATANPGRPEPSALTGFEFGPIHFQVFLDPAVVVPAAGNKRAQLRPSRRPSWALPLNSYIYAPLPSATARLTAHPRI